jgi:signal transduction histidine kinase
MQRSAIDEDKKKKYLTYINNQSVNLSNIISDLLDISRIESGRGFSLMKNRYKISETISKVFSVYKISHPNHSFYFDIEDNELVLFIDRSKIEQVLENILSNAVKYSPHGGSIRIKGVVSGNNFLLTVRDQGVGMTPSQVEKVFDKFFRGDSSDTGIEGTGLGMSIVKYIIEAHKGKVWVESKPGKGTKVSFTLPIKLKGEGKKM